MLNFSTAPTRRQLLGLCLLTLLTFGASARAVRAANASEKAFPKVQLVVAGHPEHALPAVWQHRAQQDALIDIGFDSEFHGLMSTEPVKPWILEAVPALSYRSVAVRQRSVSYLNVGAEGPHVSVPGSEQRGKWTALTAMSRGRFSVRPTAEQPIKMRHEQFAHALHDKDERWSELVKQCRTANDGPCYVITDPEFEVTVVTQSGKTIRKIIRVTQPNGC